ncbi:Zinc finger protein 483 [Frankliniella fusca]|uniref:Zinc finger protein 483 n=1 Tax=Frankliniella fusca TaxID=407009 RepID=A0AAE1HGC8_9NEOP|nr:Zinc finger protein 483 [Frankliniella fusca]
MSYTIKTTAMDESNTLCHIETLLTSGSLEEEFGYRIMENFENCFSFEAELMLENKEKEPPAYEKIAPQPDVKPITTPDKADNALAYKPTCPKTGTCKLCKKTFSYLRKHMLVHTKVKPFKCNVCGHECSQKSNLNRHYKSKHADKNFDCPICGAKFSRNDKLKEHIQKCKKVNNAKKML